MNVATLKFSGLLYGMYLAMKLQRWRKREWRSACAFSATKIPYSSPENFSAAMLIAALLRQELQQAHAPGLM